MTENLAKIDDFIKELKLFKKEGKEYVLVTSNCYTKHTGDAVKSKPRIRFEHAFSPKMLNEKNRSDLGSLPLTLGIMLIKEEELSPEVLERIKDSTSCNTEGCSVYTKNEDGICNTCKWIEV